MKKIIILSWLLSWGFSAYAQTITIKDKETKEPLELVTIAIKDSTVAVVTDALGKADISNFKNVQQLEIRMLGYKTLVKSYAELAVEPFEILMQLSSFDGQLLVVSATRWEQYANDVPSKIVTISSADVALQNPQTAADLLGSSGKVFIQKSQQAGGSPMIRGFATNRLLYTVDGIRMNTAIFRDGNIQNVISLDAFAIEGTEVLFGPGSVIYGSDAVGGVMSFQTLTPKLSADDKLLIKGSALARYSSANNEKTGHFDVNVGWKKWSLLTSLSYSDFEDLKMGNNGPIEYLKPVFVQRQDSQDVVVTNPNPLVQNPSAYSQFNLMQKLRFKPNEKWDFQYGFHYSQTSSYGRYDRHNRLKNGLPRYAEWYYGPQKWMMNNLMISNTGNNVIYDNLTIRLAQQYFEESRYDRDFNKATRHIRIEQVNAYSVNVDFNKKIGKKNTLLYGLEAVVNQVTSTGIDKNIITGIEKAGPSRYPQALWASYAAYISDQFKITDWFLLQGSLRYNHFQLNAQFDTTFYPFPFTTTSINNGALTGSLGCVIKPMKDFVISINAATAFRSPNVDDMGKLFDSGDGAVTVPNTDLKAEYAYNVDMSISKVFADIVKVDVSGYYISLQNALVRRNFTFNGMDSIYYNGALSQVQALQNAAVTEVYGLQAGLEVKFPKGFSLSSDFNYQVGFEELNDGTKSPSRHAPPWYGVTRLNYQMNKLKLQVYVIYNGERRAEDMPEEEKGKPEIYLKNSNGDLYSPSWYTLNFKALYQFTKNFTVSAGLENITDQRYRPYSTGMAGAGINFILALKAEF